MTLDDVSIEIYANRNRLSYKQIAEIVIKKVLKTIIVLSAKHYEALKANPYKAIKDLLYSYQCVQASLSLINKKPPFNIFNILSQGKEIDKLLILQLLNGGL